MNYKKTIFKMLSEIEDDDVLIYIYKMIEDVAKEDINYSSLQAKRHNKKNCKGARLSIKLMCWYFRNEKTIKSIGLTSITSLVMHSIIIGLLLLLALAFGADVQGWF